MLPDIYGEYIRAHFSGAFLDAMTPFPSVRLFVPSTIQVITVQHKSGFEGKVSVYESVDDIINYT